MRIRGAILILAAAAAFGCTRAERPVPPATRIIVEEEEAWRKVAEPGDAAAVDALPALLARLAAEAKPRFGRRLAGEAALLDPAAAAERAAPAPGPYRCRWIRLGQPGLFAVSRTAFCYVGVAEDRLTLSTETAGLRIGGYLWEEEGGRRLVFLGASVPPRSKVPPAYGTDRQRDLYGILERTGDFRYRLAVSGRGSPGQVHLVELVAAPQGD